MPERWWSDATRRLVKAVRKAGGEVERAGRGQLRITGPVGVVTIHEPSVETRRDLRSDAATRLIEERTGLDIP
jgi:hypothetical protein